MADGDLQESRDIINGVSKAERPVILETQASFNQIDRAAQDARQRADIVANVATRAEDVDRMDYLLTTARLRRSTPQPNGLDLDGARSKAAARRV